MRRNQSPGERPGHFFRLILESPFMFADMPKNKKPPKRRRSSSNVPATRYATYAEYEAAGEAAFWEQQAEGETDPEAKAEALAIAALFHQRAAAARAGAAADIAPAMLATAKAANLRVKRLPS
jgi:hypothetical protein